MVAISSCLWFDAIDALVAARVAAHAGTALTHNARHQRVPDYRRFSASVPRVHDSVIAKWAVFQSNSTKAAV
jgi:hypothetical protein